MILTLDNREQTFISPAILYAFDRNIIRCKNFADTTLKLVVSNVDIDMSYEFDAAIYGNQTDIDISYYIKLLFTNPTENRFIQNVYVEIEAQDIKFSKHISIIWGALNIGERYGSIGVFAYNPNDKAYHRELIRFTQFPWSYDMLLMYGSSVFTRIDNEPYGNERFIKDNVLFENVFDTDEYQKKVIKISECNNVVNSPYTSTYNYPFHPLGDKDTIITIRNCDNKDGYYLRWIDSFGFMQYYLFDKWKTETKIENSEKIDFGFEYGNYNFVGKRYLKKDENVTIECCATRMTKNIWLNVNTICSSVLVDMFIGYDKDNNPIWQPVNITSSSYSINEKDKLFDLDVKFELSSKNIQTL